MHITGFAHTYKFNASDNEVIERLIREERENPALSDPFDGSMRFHGVELKEGFHTFVAPVEEDNSQNYFGVNGYSIDDGAFVTKVNYAEKYTLEIPDDKIESFFSVIKKVAGRSGGNEAIYRVSANPTKSRTFGKYVLSSLHQELIQELTKGKLSGIGIKMEKAGVGEKTMVQFLEVISKSKDGALVVSKRAL